MITHFFQTFPFFGVEPVLLDEEGHLIEGPGEGYLVFKRPWPGMMRTLFGNHERFEETYFSRFQGYYATGDGKLYLALPDSEATSSSRVQHAKQMSALIEAPLGRLDFEDFQNFQEPDETKMATSGSLVGSMTC